MWVKVLDGGAVRHTNWAANYAAMREAANCSGEGYLSHEAALWDDASNRWLFMPRTNPDPDPNLPLALTLTLTLTLTLPLPLPLPLPLTLPR